MPDIGTDSVWNIHLLVKKGIIVLGNLLHLLLRQYKVNGW